MVKRAIDIAAVMVAAPFVLPVMAACAVAIRVETPGPAVFSQPRTGQDGRPFKMYKFRTMVRDAHLMKESLQHLSIVPYPDFKIIDDPRITRVGKVLRKTSLDELPQLWNILQGDMSLVGPRPTSFSPSTYDLWHTRRLEVRPGITGIWQVYGRNTTDFDERIRLDEQYIRTRSIALDLKLILLTVPSVLRGRGA